MTFRSQKTLIQREYWENGHLLLRLPLWLGVIISVTILAVAALSYSSHVHFHSSIMGHMHVTPHNTAIHMVQSANFIIPIFGVFLWITLFTYALRTLYTDRKDGSIFFWQSLPTSQFSIILSKLIAIFFIAPFCAWICLTATQCVFYLAIAMGHFGFNFSHFSTPHFLGDALINIVSNLYKLWFVGLWLAPIIGLCMISSAYSKRSPAVAVFVVLLLICILDAIFTHSHIIARFVLSCFGNSLNGGLGIASTPTVSFAALGTSSTHMVIRFVIGLVIAIIGFVTAGIIRSKNHDFKL